MVITRKEKLMDMKKILKMIEEAFERAEKEREEKERKEGGKK